MFVSAEAVLDAEFPAARAGLCRLINGGWLTAASDGAYSDGLSGMIRVGPFGNVALASKLVRVLVLEPVEHEDSVLVVLRWEATGVMGKLFPVLDANIVLTPVGPATCQLKLMGAYRPPLAALGVGLDAVVLRHAADATVRSLVKRVASSIVPTPLGTNGSLS